MRRSSLRTIPLILAVVLCGAGLSRGEDGVPGQLHCGWVLNRGGLDAPARRMTRPEAVRQHVAEVVTSRLYGPAVRAGDTLAFDLAPGTRLLGVVQDIQRGGPRETTLTGLVQGQPGATFAIAIVEDCASADIRLPGGHTWEIRPIGGGMHTITEVDESLQMPCGVDAKAAALMAADIAAAQARGGSGDSSGGGADSGAYIDVFVAYTNAARVSNGGTAGVKSLINLGVSHANTAYANSNVSQRIALVGTAEVAYTEDGSSSLDLSRFTNPSDGFMDEVHGLRELHRADLVALIQDYSTTACGVAYLLTTTSGLPNLGFSVTLDSCISGQTFGHELGHNMGLAHGRGDGGGASGGIFSYSYGWRFFATDSNQYRTVMAYAPGTRIQHFSNPDVLYLGTPTGVAVGAADEANNALTLNQTASIVANYRQSNDDFENRIPLGGGNASVTGHTIGKTAQAGEPAHAGAAGGKSAWWSWTPSTNATATINTAGSGIDTLLGVYTGTAVGGLTLVASHDNVSGVDLTSTVTFPATAGTEYKIAVDGKAAAEGPVALTVSTTAPPTIAVTPASLGVLAINGQSPASQAFQISNAGGSTLNYSISDDAAWLSASPGSGSTVASAQVITVGFSTTAMAPGNYSATITVTAAGATNTPVAIPVSLQIIAGPDNDPFAAPYILAGSSDTDNGTNIGATKETGEPDHHGNAGGASVWWNWTSPGTGTAQVTTAGSDFDTILGVYTGSTVGGLSFIASDDDGVAPGGASLVSFTATQGTTYRIAVDGWGAATGFVTIAVNGPSTVGEWTEH